jgi:hypothetical protein
MTACRGLIAVADSLIGRRIEVQPFVVLEEWARATKTFRAAVTVSGAGFGPQGHMLGRSIFESAMLIMWAVRHADIADRYVELHTLLGIERHVAARRNAGFWAKETASHMTPEERSEAVTLFGRRGTAYWSGHRNLEDLVKENIAELDDLFTKSQYEAVFYVLIGWCMPPGCPREASALRTPLTLT